MVMSADAITTVSAPILKHFERQARRDGQILGEIRNGFDYFPVISGSSGTGTFRLVYAGSFYGNIKPDKFFNQMERVIGAGVDISLTIFGGNPALHIPSTLRGHVEVHGRIPHEEMIKRLTQFDGFLLVYPSGARKGVFTGKLFDYLGINRPIIGLVDPDDSAGRLIREANAGYVVANEGGDAVGEVLLSAIRDWLSGNLPQRNWEVVMQHQRSVQIGKMQGYVDSLISHI